MSGNRIVWTGLEEWKAEFRALPAALGGEGATLVERRGTSAAATIAAGYPARLGDLRDHLEVTHTRSAFGARSDVRNTSPVAEWFEHGTQARHYITHHGVRHLTGKMPANHLFSRTMARERRGLSGDLTDLLVRHGLTVTGDA